MPGENQENYEYLFFCDFDGTVTGRGGSDTVNSTFYKSLVKNYAENAYNYRYAELRSENELITMFTSCFGNYDPTKDYSTTPDHEFLLSQESIDFLHEVLRHPNAKFHFVTRNKEGYIKALLAYQGFTQDEITKIEIRRCSDTTLGKEGHVTEAISNKYPNLKKVFIFDDDIGDHRKMMIGASKAKVARENQNMHKFEIEGCNMSIGQFEWRKYKENFIELDSSKIPTDTSVKEATSSNAPLPIQAHNNIPTPSQNTPQKAESSQEQDKQADSDNKEPIRQENKMPNILVLTDFDGTVTNRSGDKTTFSPFYQSLLKPYEAHHNTKTNRKEACYKGVDGNGKPVEMKSPDEVQRIFLETFGPYNENFNYSQPDTDLLMSRETVEFFKDMLNKPDVKITIVTRNRQDYIKALFKYQGITDEQFSKLTIIDRVKFKNELVKEYLNTQTNTTGLTACYIFDDKQDEYERMRQGVKESKLAQTIQCYGDRNDPGSFEWARYKDEINQKLMSKKPLNESKPQEVVPKNPPEVQPHEEQKPVELANKTPTRQELNIDKVNEALISLQSKIGTLRDHEEFLGAYTAANTLLDNLRRARDIYDEALQHPDSDKNAAVEAFKKSCARSIESAKPTLERDLGWGDYLSNLCKSLFNAVISTFSANPNSLFAIKRPASVEAVEEVKQCLELGQNTAPKA